MSYPRKGTQPAAGGAGQGGKQQSRYQLQMKGKQGQSSIRLQGQSERGLGRKESSDKAIQRREGDEIDAIFGFERLKEGPERLGWLLNYLPITMPDETGMEKAAMDLYFIDREGGNFKATVFYEPYFYVDVKDSRRLIEISQTLQKRFEGCRVEQADLEDLDLANHLSGKKHRFLKISFGTVSELMDAKSALRLAYIIPFSLNEVLCLDRNR
jgi:DNA polymerase epsilon subunit 1